jgi:hypothetical protein
MFLFNPYFTLFFFRWFLFTLFYSLETNGNWVVTMGRVILLFPDPQSHLSLYFQDFQDNTGAGTAR